MKKLVSLSAALCLCMASMTVAAANGEGQALNEQGLVYSDFNKVDVNGRVFLTVPENVSAAVDITFDSPEVTDEPYYVRIVSGGTFYFDIEGRDNSEDDYRNYHICVEVTGGPCDITAEPFTADFTVPDGNDDPDSYREISYVFTNDGEITGNDWDVVSQEENETNIALHLDGIIQGDVDGNGKADASDASLILAEYSRLSTGGGYSFNDRQKKLANVCYDTKIDASDASKVLVYYSYVSTGKPVDGIFDPPAYFPGE